MQENINFMSSTYCF